MMIIDVKANGIDKRFMTNDNGGNLFIIEDGAAKQLDCCGGYQSLRYIKKAIREHLVYQYGNVPKLAYKPMPDSGWKK